jgi:hypothetical protein
MNPQRSGTNAAAVTKDRKKPPLHSLLNIDDYAKVTEDGDQESMGLLFKCSRRPHHSRRQQHDVQPNLVPAPGSEECADGGYEIQNPRL